ncbi:MAG: multicopper oxidase domain-containing protein [Bdellovibrionales bacterium]|nr:multicopper oxidase domain-containing protein [Bdellovibrionales bacterium]
MIQNFALYWIRTLFLMLIFGQCLIAETQERSLVISSKRMNFTGETVEALTVNGTIPAPVLRFTEGDSVVIHVKNTLSENASIHWHGILLPNRMDGVPDMTYPPIKPGETFTYRFKLRQSGTYWYHSHSGLQEQRGLYGAFVIEPRSKTKVDRIPDKVLVLSDWTDEDPRSVLHTLKRGSEWYSIQKNSAQSILGAASIGMLGDYFTRELSRMPAMDISDIHYDKFLINGASTTELADIGGAELRLRIINGSASTFFYTQVAGTKMKIVSADGQAVVPFEVDRLLLGVAETYDVIVPVESGVSREFRATSHDNVGSASFWLGNGERQFAPEIPFPNLYKSMHGPSFTGLIAITPWGAMGMDSPKSNANHHHMHHGMKMKAPEPVKKRQGSSQEFRRALGLLAEDISAQGDLAMSASLDRPNPPYERLRAPAKTVFDKDRVVREIPFTLDGDMGRYVWMLNNKVMSEADSIKIKKGEVVRFVMTNRTMMYHPMHLHGHFFRVLNKHGEFSPLKHTVVVAPMQTTTIEFDASEKGDWFFHCHLLYHMMSGMAGMLHYEGFAPPADVDQSKLLMDDYFYMGEVSGLSNMAQGEFAVTSSRNIFSAEWQVGWAHVENEEWEATALYEYYLNRFWNVFVGANVEGEQDQVESEHGVAGFRFLLPLNVETRHWLDSDLGYQVSLKKSLELTPRFHLYGESEYDSESKWELRVGGHYQLSRDWALKAQWHSDYKWGAGLEFSF